MCNRAMFFQKMKSHHAKHPHFGPRGFGRMGRHPHFQAAHNYPPVNIEELDDRYVLSLHAPGYAKGDFQISLVDNILTVKVEKNNDPMEVNWRRQEFSSKGFERGFELNDKIDKEKIGAKYTDGILQLTLTKIEGSETVRTKISVD